MQQNKNMPKVTTIRNKSFRTPQPAAMDLMELPSAQPKPENECLPTRQLKTVSFAADHQPRLYQPSTLRSENSDMRAFMFGGVTQRQQMPSNDVQSEWSSPAYDLSTSHLEAFAHPSIPQVFRDGQPINEDRAPVRSVAVCSLIQAMRTEAVGFAATRLRLQPVSPRCKTIRHQNGPTTTRTSTLTSSMTCNVPPEQMQRHPACTVNYYHQQEASQS